MPTFEYRSSLAFPPEEVFSWHGRPLALERLTPPWERFRIERRNGGIQDGGEVWIRQKLGPFWFRWHSRHSGYEENRRFYDEAVSGPFTKWQHTHTFEPDPAGSRLHDRIDYAFPGGRMGELALGGTVRRSLERTFRYRHETTREDLARHRESLDRPRLRVAIAGASGLLGSALAAFLSTGGHEVRRLVRRPAQGAGEIAWDPESGRLDAAALEGLDAVVNLCGVSLERGRWSRTRKEAILRSRVSSTSLLARTLAAMKSPPSVFVSMSAVGIYGEHGDDAVTETAAPGAGFLAQVCRQWESAASPASSAGIRVVHPRLGMVLTPAAGLLGRALPLFRAGLGGRFGSGRQWWSWVSLDDVLYALHTAILDASLAGPVNVMAPVPVRNQDFARTLGRVLRRPAGVPAPAAALTALLGDKAKEGLLTSTRALPAKLVAAGHRFSSGSLEVSLRRCLGLVSPT